MTSLGLQGWLIQIVGVIVALAVATGRFWPRLRSPGPDGAFLIWTVGAGPGGGHRSKGWVQVESFAGCVPGRRAGCLNGGS